MLLTTTPFSDTLLSFDNHGDYYSVNNYYQLSLTPVDGAQANNFDISYKYGGCPSNYDMYLPSRYQMGPVARFIAEVKLGANMYEIAASQGSSYVATLDKCKRPIE